MRPLQPLKPVTAHTTNLAQRTVKSKPSAAELNALTEEESVRFGFNGRGSDSRSPARGLSSHPVSPPSEPCASGSDNLPGSRLYRGRVGCARCSDLRSIELPCWSQSQSLHSDKPVALADTSHDAAGRCLALESGTSADVYEYDSYSEHGFAPERLLPKGETAMGSICIHKPISAAGLGVGTAATWQWAGGGGRPPVSITCSNSTGPPLPPAPASFTGRNAGAPHPPVSRMAYGAQFAPGPGCCVGSGAVQGCHPGIASGADEQPKAMNSGHGRDSSSGRELSPTGALVWPREYQHQPSRPPQLGHVAVCRPEPPPAPSAHQVIPVPKKPPPNPPTQPTMRPTTERVLDAQPPALAEVCSVPDLVGQMPLLPSGWHPPFAQALPLHQVPGQRAVPPHLLLRRQRRQSSSDPDVAAKPCRHSPGLTVAATAAAATATATICSVASGRRAQQRSAPSSRFVSDDEPDVVDQQRPLWRDGVGRYAPSSGLHVNRNAPHTADGSEVAEGYGRVGAHRGSHFDYKPYTGKVSSEYMNLGKLKPDLNTEELVRKRANAERVKLFSKNLRVINRQEQEDTAPARPVSMVSKSKRETAKAYAANVPKPRVRLPVTSDDEFIPDGNGHEELDSLRALERQHTEHQRQAAIIRTELGMD